MPETTKSGPISAPTASAALASLVGLAALMLHPSGPVPVSAFCGVSLFWGIVCWRTGRGVRVRDRGRWQKLAADLNELGAETEALFGNLSQQCNAQLDSIREENRQVRDLLNGAMETLLQSFHGLEENSRSQQDLVLQLTLGSGSKGGGEASFDAFLREIESVLNDFVDVSAKNSDSATVLAAKVKGTKADFQEVSNMLGEIRKIADQTNLLAINAAVEAARAGKSGKGFAVVAGEVRQLSERSNAFSRQIENSVDSIADSLIAVEQSVQAMAQEGMSLVMESKERVDEVLEKNQSFNRKIEHSVQDISKIADRAGKEVAAAVTSLQFHDMTSQVLSHMEKRTELMSTVLNELGSLSLAGAGEEGADLGSDCDRRLLRLKSRLAEAANLVEKVRHNPVSQKSMDVGSVELF